MSGPGPAAARRRALRAFTLVEVIVVIAILALLAGVLIPALGHARDHAKTTVCQANIRQLMNAFTMYTVESKGRLPGASYDFGSDWLGWSNKHAITGQTPGRSPDDGVIYKYMGTQRYAYTCPVVPHVPTPPNINGWHFSYAYNALLVGARPEMVAGAHHPLENFDRDDHLTRMRAFDGVPVLLEPYAMRIRPPARSAGDVESRFLTGDTLTDRHLRSGGRRGWSNVAFLDGHAGRVGLPGIADARKADLPIWSKLHFTASAMCVRTTAGKWVTARAVNPDVSTYGLADRLSAADTGVFTEGRLKWRPVTHASDQ